MQEPTPRLRADKIAYFIKMAKVSGYNQFNVISIKILQAWFALWNNIDVSRLGFGHSHEKITFLEFRGTAKLPCADGSYFGDEPQRYFQTTGDMGGIDIYQNFFLICIVLYFKIMYLMSALQCI